MEQEVDDDVGIVIGADVVQTDVPRDVGLSVERI